MVVGDASADGVDQGIAPACRLYPCVARALPTRRRRELFCGVLVRDVRGCRCVCVLYESIHVLYMYTSTQRTCTCSSRAFARERFARKPTAHRTVVGARDKSTTAHPCIRAERRSLPQCFHILGK